MKSKNTSYMFKFNLIQAIFGCSCHVSKICLDFNIFNFIILIQNIRIIGKKPEFV